jgi:ferrous iron transport protein A
VSEPVSLNRLGLGARGTVRKISGGREVASRLAALGMTVGADIEVLQNSGHGPLLVRVRDTRVALGRGVALKVLVEERKGGGSERQS